MNQPTARKQPGIPMWVWILVLIAIIIAIWWVFDSMNEPEPLQEPTVEIEEGGEIGALGTAPAWIDETVVAAGRGQTWLPPALRAA